MQVAQGNLPAALNSYHASLAIGDRLVKFDRGNASWHHDLSVSYEKIGDVQVAGGDLPAALELLSRPVSPLETAWRSPIPAMPAGSTICRCPTRKSATSRWRRAICLRRWTPIGRVSPLRDRLAKSDPGNAGWQHDLSVSYEKVGDVQVAQGYLPAALDSSRADFAVKTAWRSPIPAMPARSTICRCPAESRRRAGGPGNLPVALASYQVSLAIRDRLAMFDPGNTGWQRDLSVSYDKVGDVQVAQGNLPAALASYQTGFAIRDQPGEAQSRQYRLAARSVGVVQQSRQRAGATTAICRRRWTSIRRALPSAIAWRSPIPAMPAGSAICRCRTTKSATCSWPTAICRRRWPPIRRASPSETAWRSPIPAMPAGITTCRRPTRKLATCRWRKAISGCAGLLSGEPRHRDRLTKSDPGNAGWHHDLSTSYEKVGDVQVAQGNLPAALASYQVSLAIRDRLTKSDPGKSAGSAICR